MRRTGYGAGPLEPALDCPRGQLRISASAHSLQDAIEVEVNSVDWVVLGPTYDTQPKRGLGPRQGLDRLARVATAVKIPVILIGGIAPARVREVKGAGARRAAVISATLTADAPAGATRRLLEVLAP